MTAINPYDRDDWDFYNYDDDPDFFEFARNNYIWFCILENDDSIWK